MTRAWFPEASSMPYGGGYLPLYRWYIGEPFKQLPGGRKPLPTAAEARKAAREYMAAPAIITAWRKEKAEDAATERARVFGDAKPTIVWAANGRAVPIERRRIA